MIGKTISHYKIIEKLGEGGMGVVYKAEDTKLKRQVAIKFLPDYISSNQEEKQRFEIEAQAAASLNHPNITTIYSIEEADGQVFIVMEYIDGKELKDIAGAYRDMPLPINDVLNYAIHIAEGLEAAHKKGIVHRDIKSSNIMITEDGKVKIMDFGLAKIGKGAQVTKIGSTVGTIAYMSPEQARGEELDNRTDIWSFGVVLYEMLTGKQPFKGDYDQAVIYSILNEEPESLGNISLELNSIIQKALSKDLVSRYQNVNEMLADLIELKNESFSKTYSRSSTIKSQEKKKSKKWFVPAAISLFIVLLIASYIYFNNLAGEKESTSERKMIVVLPFENLGPSENEYFADGLTEEITSKLSGLSKLGVIARQSAMQYKKTTKSVQQIGEELGVSYILQGTVRWENVAGNEHVRVTPQLIDVSEGTQIWSQASEEILSSSFKLQSEIAESVVQALDIKLVLSEKKTLTADITTNAEAYEYYLRGITLFRKSYNERDYRAAEEMLLKATELDPNFSHAYAILSTVHSGIYWEYFDHTENRALKAKLAAEKALELEPNLIEGHV
ncbi:MAG: serine/threonine-protein kinase, partial [Ignavibacteria bacterium]|nr:serine/threonine-protein kinase [Ignavibacteria bacterium]